MTITILVIEDERLTRNSLISFLRSEGFTTLDASNGHTGIQLAQQHLPDLIICDILMPDLDGYDVLTTLQGNAQTAGIPFIFLTVTATEEGLQQSIDMGADDYLSKPITSDKLRVAITAQLKKTSANIADATSPFSALDASLTSDRQPPSTSVEDAKSALLDELCIKLQKQLIQCRTTLDSLGQELTTSEQRTSFNQLQSEFTRLLSMVNETNALQASLTPENVDTLLKLFEHSLSD